MTNNKHQAPHTKYLTFFCFLFFIFCFLLSTSCNSPFTQKPRGYYKINFPGKQYRLFDEPGYPYSFEYPVYANVSKDSVFFNEDAENPWWLNIDFPQFAGKIYMSYKVIGKYKLDTLINDAFNLTNKHSIKATGIDDSLLLNKFGVHGMYFQLQGNVATENQFFLTDSVHHFLRGSLYFYATPNQDSIQPVNDFIKQDMMHLISTFNWK
jgi:gliding motility-associated lipoprotein GldD